MRFTIAMTRCTSAVCTCVLTGVLLHTYTVDPRPEHAVHHEAVHVLHVPEPGHSTESVVNSAPAASGAPTAGYPRWWLPGL